MPLAFFYTSFLKKVHRALMFLLSYYILMTWSCFAYCTSERWWRNGEGAGLECGRCPVRDEMGAICFQTYIARNGEVVLWWRWLIDWRGIAIVTVIMKIIFFSNSFLTILVFIKLQNIKCKFWKYFQCNFYNQFLAEFPSFSCQIDYWKVSKMQWKSNRKCCRFDI